jgi:hypothetical protein
MLPAAEVVAADIETVFVVVPETDIGDVPSTLVTPPAAIVSHVASPVVESQTKNCPSVAATSDTSAIAAKFMPLTLTEDSK